MPKKKKQENQESYLKSLIMHVLVTKNGSKTKRETREGITKD